jgi:shikimate dehydrogenase
VPDWRAHDGPVCVLGAGGAARAIVYGFLDAGVDEVRVFNRTRSRAEALAESVSGPVTVFEWDEAATALEGAGLIVNATTVGLEGAGDLLMPMQHMAASAVAMDMIYRPLRTPFLGRAATLGLTVVDGLEMLIRQAIPSFEAFFGVEAPSVVDARALALAELERTA